ncbi:hypothetical protein A0J61_07262 [Choanephora cucurbitarum]|uniref:Uncharacterized protein n=1 Tax=Choanephora cucurbitarum TaxID=101091 RepID=A0A1C7N7U1_9FUNG|nr:hypothetical protein A0J61_07262 [Choanephora cucurbitarum]
MDPKEHERQEKRRLRRQERILASAESRLHKITATIFREWTPSPSNSDALSLAEHYPASNDTRRRKYERSITPSPSSSAKHRPVVQQLIEEEEQQQQQKVQLNGWLGDKVPHLLLAYMLRRTSIRPKRSSDPANRYWHLLHFLSMAWLGFLAVYEQASIHGWTHVSSLIKTHPTHPIVQFPVFIYFVILEFLLRFGRTIYQPNDKSPDQAAFINMVSQLPPPLQQPVYWIQTYGLLIHSLFKDVCIVVFMIGFTGLFLLVFKN